jgi:peptidoglycan/LPS O-acetylase OafA/YrhL
MSIATRLQRASSPDIAGGIDTHNRLPGIDVVRCIAAGAVLLSHITHATTILRPAWIRAHKPSLYALEQFFCVPLGHWGVGLFFVLSGFCIHLPLAKAAALTGSHPHLDLRRYYARRFTRIYPPHLVALVLSIVAALYIPSGFFTEAPVTVPTSWQLFAHLMMIHSFFPNARYSINGVLWTISIETHFYLFYPLLARMRRRMSFFAIVLILLAISIGSKAAMKLIYPGYAYLWGENFVGRFWEWALGCLVAERLVVKARARHSSWTWFLALLIGSYAFTLLTAFLPHGGAILARTQPLLFALAISAGARLPPLQTIVYRFAVATGLQSYSLYLTHPIAISVVCVFLASFGMSLLIQWIFALVASGVMCALFFRGVERPFLVRSSRLRARTA